MITSARGGGQGWSASVGDREIRWNSLTLARQNQGQKWVRFCQKGLEATRGRGDRVRWDSEDKRHGTTEHGEHKQYGAQGWKWTETEIPSGDRCTADGLQASVGQINTVCVLPWESDSPWYRGRVGGEEVVVLLPLGPSTEPTPAVCHHWVWVIWL